jgi:hypothetical protein
MNSNPFQKKCFQWKWTSGEVYARSRRPPPKSSSSNQDYSNNYGVDVNFSADQEKAAYTTALNHDENTWDILNQSATLSEPSCMFRNSNKREDMDFKIADRDMMQQRGANPFNPGSNYANDVVNFMAPGSGR